MLVRWCWLFLPFLSWFLLTLISRFSFFRSISVWYLKISDLQWFFSYLQKLVQGYLVQFGVLCSTFPLHGSVLLEENLHQLKCFFFFFLWLYIVWFFSFILNYLLFPLTSNNRRLWIGWEVWVTFIRVLSSRAPCSIARGAVKLLINQWMACFMGRVYMSFDLMICGPSVLQKVYNAISVVFLPKMSNQIMQTQPGKYEL